MAISAIYEARRRIAVREFGDIIVTAEIQQLSLLYSSGLNHRVVPSPSAAQPSICPSSERI
jgi:hypothetical protein